MTHHDTDPTPPQGTPRPSKFRTMVRLAAALETQINQTTERCHELETELRTLQARRSNMISDLADLNQLMIDMTPEA